MPFEEVLHGFRQRFLEASHLQTFLDERPFVIVLEAETNNYLLSLSKSNISVIKNNFGENQVGVIIQASEDTFEKLLNGKEYLRKLEKHHELKVQGSYSAMLKAETIFYLNYSYMSP